jgi:hypothetical protein
VFCFAVFGFLRETKKKQVLGKKTKQNKTTRVIVSCFRFFSFLSSPAKNTQDQNLPQMGASGRFRRRAEGPGKIIKKKGETQSDEIARKQEQRHT